MMKTGISKYILILSFSLTGLSVLSGCEKDSFCNCLQSTGNEASETRILPDFTSIEMNQNVDVVIRKGSVPMVTITGGEKLLDGIRTKVENGKLYISNQNKCNWLRDYKNRFTVEVHYNELFFLTIRGSGNFNCADTLTSDEFQVDSWNGSGTLSLLLNCKEVRLKLHTGPADINAAGRADVLYLYTAGNGFMRTAALVSDYTYVTTKSTGDTEVHPVKELEAIIEYQGDVKYRGNPPVIRPVISGSGKLIAF